MSEGKFRGRAAPEQRREALEEEGGETLAQWFADPINARHCRAIANRLHYRAQSMRERGRHGAALECDNIAGLIAVGDFDWKF
jgi:hypothetical protein